MTDDKYSLVHVNIAEGRGSMDDPVMKGFVDRIEQIDMLAHGWPGFISQPTPPDAGMVYKGNILVNLSIWDSVENLREFTYGSQHARALEMRAEWFLQSDRPNYVLYWFPVGEIPTEVEINRRFEYLNRNGTTPYAFTFEQPFTVDEMLSFHYKG